MKVFVINLGRRKERMAYMERQLRAMGIAYERIDAIDGRQLSIEERCAAVRGFKWWCINGYCARSGEIGCALSHQEVYRLMVRQGLLCACVLEDDVELDERFSEMLAAAERFVGGGEERDVLLLSPYAGREENNGVEISFKGVNWAFSAGGYVLTRSAAERLLAVNGPLQSTADNWGRWAKRGGLKLYDANPIVCRQEEYASVPSNPDFVSDTIGENVKFVKDMSLGRRIVHKAGRLVGKVIDKLLPS